MDRPPGARHARHGDLEGGFALLGSHWSQRDPLSPELVVPHFAAPTTIAQINLSNNLLASSALTVLTDAALPQLRQLLLSSNNLRTITTLPVLRTLEYLLVHK